MVPSSDSRALALALAAEIEQRRLAAGLIQAELWARAGLTRSTYRRIVNAHVSATFEQVVAIACALDTSPGELSDAVFDRARTTDTTRTAQTSADRFAEVLGG